MNIFVLIFANVFYNKAAYVFILYILTWSERDASSTAKTKSYYF